MNYQRINALLINYGLSVHTKRRLPDIMAEVTLDFTGVTLSNFDITMDPYGAVRCSNGIIRGGKTPEERMKSMSNFLKQKVSF